MALHVATLVARVVAETSGFNAGMTEVQGRLASTSASMRSTGLAMTRGLTVPLLAAAAVGTKFAIDFQAQMERIHTQAGISQKGVDSLSKSVMQLAPSTAFGPAELAKGMYHIASVMATLGTSTADMMKVLKVAADGAALGGANLEDTTSALAGTMRVFHVGAGGAATIMGQLNAIVGAGNMRMQDLNNAISTGLLPTASGLGIGLNAVGAALATMTDESVPAQVAATRMRTLLLLMTGETKKNVDTLSQLGIKQGELGKMMRTPGGMIPALQDLQDHLSKLGKTDQVRILAQAFGGARSAGTIIQLLNNLEMVRGKFKQINDTASNFPADVLAQQQTAAYQLHQAWAAVQTVLTSIGAIIAPVVVAIAKTIAQLVSEFEKLPPSVQHVAVFAALAVAAIGPLLFLFGALLTPVGLTVAAVAALGAAGVELYNHFKPVHDAIRGVTDALGLTHPKFVQGVTDFGQVSGETTRMNQVLNASKSVWASIGPAVTNAFNVIRGAAQTVIAFVIAEWNKMVTGIKAHSAEIKAFVTAAWNDIVGISKAVWPIISAVVKVAWDLIKNYVDTALKIIGNIILAVMDVISGNWHGAWVAIVNAAKALLHGFITELKIIIEKGGPVALAAAKLVGTAIWNGLKAGLNALSELATYLSNKMRDGLNWAVNWASGAFVAVGQAIVSGIVSGVTGVAGSIKDAVVGAVKGAYTGALHWAGIKSPSKVFAEGVGKPIGEGILMGYLEGTASLPTKMKESLRKAIEAAKNEVDAARTKMSAAFQALADYGMRAFDATTQKHLTQMSGKFDQLIKRAVTDPLAKALAKAKSQYDKFISDIAASHDKMITAIDATYGAPTPSEAELARLQEAHNQEGLQDALKKAQGDLATASGTDPKAQADAQDKLTKAIQGQAEALDKLGDAQRILQTYQDAHPDGGDPIKVDDLQEKVTKAQQIYDDYVSKVQAAQDAVTAASTPDAQGILDAQQAIKDAQYNIDVDALQKKATLERADMDKQKAAATELADWLTGQQTIAADADYAARQAAIEKKYGLVQGSLTKTYNQQVLNYTSERDLQKLHLGVMLQTLETQLAKHPGEWKKIHNKIMTMFKVDFGPDYKTAGKNLGKGFAEGIRESFSTVEDTLAEFARLVAKYLKLKSPAEKGPLSTLDHWWDAFAKTLTQGIDWNWMNNNISKLMSPANAAAWGPGAVVHPQTHGTGGGELSREPHVTEIHMHLPHYVGNYDDLASALREVLPMMDRAVPGGVLNTQVRLG